MHHYTCFPFIYLKIKGLLKVVSGNREAETPDATRCPTFNFFMHKNNKLAIDDPNPEQEKIFGLLEEES
jgi:hypothetical protein